MVLSSYYFRYWQNRSIFNRIKLKYKYIDIFIYSYIITLYIHPPTHYTMTSTHSVDKGGECEICGNKLAKDELKTIKISNMSSPPLCTLCVDNSFIFPSLGKCKKCGKYERDMKQKKEKISELKLKLSF